ncbi:MAG: cohesin domain-containing protein [Candidatus Bipolaricaulia bacterium]
MKNFNYSKKYLLIVFLGVVFFCPSSLVQAQGTSLSIEGAQVTAGETVTLNITLTEAIDGLGRFDASIVSSNPQVLQLQSITPKAVSKQFLQIDSEKADRIKFKMVDLGKKIGPGAQGVQLLSLKVKALKQGESEISLTEMKYTDEAGNVIEPKVKPATVTIESSAPPEEKQGTAEPGQGTQADKRQVETKDKKSQQEEKQKGVKGSDSGEEEKNYLPSIEEIKLNLGETGKITLNISSLPEGLRLVQAWIISSGGVSFDKVRVLNPAYSVVVKKTDKLVSFRAGDFDGKIGSKEGELAVSEIGVKAVKVGKTSIRTKLVAWTDEGKKVVRQGKPTDITVTIGSIGTSKKAPNDLDGDGLFEDVDGDGELTKKDVFTLAFNLQSESVQNSPSLFDFNWDGQVSFGDAVNLIKTIEER